MTGYLLKEPVYPKYLLRKRIVPLCLAPIPVQKRMDIPFPIREDIAEGQQSPFLFLFIIQYPPPLSGLYFSKIF